MDNRETIRHRLTATWHTCCRALIVYIHMYIVGLHLKIRSPGIEHTRSGAETIFQQGGRGQNLLLPCASWYRPKNKNTYMYT